jgi:hypothetical protein
MVLSRLAGHEHRRAPCNLNYRELYCSRGAVWVYRMGCVHVINIPPPYERFTPSCPGRLTPV